MQQEQTNDQQFVSGVVIVRSGNDIQFYNTLLSKTCTS